MATSLMYKIELLRRDLHSSGFVICTLSETCLSNTIEYKLATVTGHQFVRFDRNLKLQNDWVKRVGRLRIYYQNGLNVDTKLHAAQGSSEANIELQYAIVDRPCTKRMPIDNIHRPPDGNIEEALDKLD